jgi:hypothetical protein
MDTQTEAIVGRTVFFLRIGEEYQQSWLKSAPGEFASQLVVKAKTVFANFITTMRCPT